MGITLPQSLSELNLLRRQFGIADDFAAFSSGGVWTDTSPDSGAAVNGGDGLGGRVTLATGATDNNECYLHSTRELFLFSPQRPIVFEARVQYAEANVDDANVCLGLMDAVGADALVDNGGGPKASYSGMLFYKVDGETVWQAESSVGSSQTTTVLSATGALDRRAHAAVGSVFETYRIEFRPLTTTEAEICFFLNDVHVAKHLISYSGATEMQALIGVKAGGANSEQVVVDYVSCLQVR